VLPVLCLSVFLVVVDNTIVNVALPQLAHSLKSSNSGLQWIVDAYSLPFAGLLLFGGALGDRIGRKTVMQWALVGFGLTSILASFASSTGQLIAARALMGVTAAFVFPASLAILTHIFQDPSDRAKAIGAWGATSGLSVALGPIAGGALLQHFWYGSIFLVNVPIVLATVILGHALIPNSKSPSSHSFDFRGVVLGSSAVTASVFTIIQAPTWGWASPQALVAYVISIILLVLFVLLELRTEGPMLDVRVFRNARFSTGAMAIAVGFFVLFGFIFLVTQYFQLVQGYSTLSAGVRTLPFAITMAATTPLFAVLALKIGTKIVVSFGLFMMTAAMLMAGFLRAESSYLGILVISMVMLSLGLASITAPASAAVMESLTPEQLGAGSAVNNVTRELGGTLGVAVVGSVFASLYAPKLRELWQHYRVPAHFVDQASASMAAAVQVASHAPSSAQSALAQGANQAFMAGFNIACFTAAGVAFIGGVIAVRFLPARAAAAEFDDFSIAATQG